MYTSVGLVIFAHITHVLDRFGLIVSVEILLAASTRPS